MGNERVAEGLGDAGTANVLSGAVAGHSVQAGAIHGDLHFYQARHASPLIPRQLPRPSAHFTNREEELAALEEVSSAPPILAVLSGPGGVGKTALALWWASQIQDRFPDGQLYIDLSGFSGDEPVDPTEALTAFLRALGAKPQQLPVKLAELAALYRSMTAGRCLLVLLDNAFSAAQVRVLLPGSSDSAVVVTSRSRLAGLSSDGARLVHIGPLPTRHAVALLGRAAGEARISREGERAVELVRMCGGMPIAVCLAGARLASRPRLSLTRMAADFTREQDRLRALSTHDGPSIQAAFDVSYRFLVASAAVLYRGLALHPGQEFGLGVVASLIAAAGSDAGWTDPLDTLVQANLLEEVGDDRFRFHDLLRIHARERAQMDNTEQERDLAQRAMLEWYLAAALEADHVVTPYRRRLPYEFASAPIELPAFTDREAALSWLEQERANLISAGRTALEQDWPELAWHLSDVMWPLLLYRKHYRDRLEIDRRGVAAARRWGNAWAEADMLKRLGRVSTTVGSLDEAEEHYRLAVSQYAESGDRRGVADAQEGLALLFLDTGRPTEAIALLRRLLVVNDEFGDDRSTGLTLINLGLALPQLGRHREALNLLTRAQTIFGALSDVDPYNQARVLIAQARAHLELGELDSAHEAAEQAERAMRGLGSENGEAEALELLGEVAHRRGEHDIALTRWRRALEIFLSLGSTRVAAVRARLAELASPADGSHEGAGPPP